MTNMRGTASTFLAEFAVFGALFHAKRATYFLQKQQQKEWVSETVYFKPVNKAKAIVIGLGSIG